MVVAISSRLVDAFFHLLFGFRVNVEFKCIFVIDFFFLVFQV